MSLVIIKGMPCENTFWHVKIDTERKIDALPALYVGVFRWLFRRVYFAK